MVLLRMLGSKVLKRVNATKANREDSAAEHLRPSFVPLIEQTLLGRVGLTLGHSAAPDGEQYGYDAADHESHVADSRAEGFPIVS